MKKPNSTVKKIIMMVRHGERSPLIIPEGETYWKPPTASLTSKGASTMFSKGKILREYLKDFLDKKTFNKDTMRIYSSNLNRTIMTAYYYIRGIFNIETSCDSVATEQEALSYLNQYNFIRKPIQYDIVNRYYNSGISKTFQENVLKENEKCNKQRIGIDAIAKLLPYLPPNSKISLDNINYFKLNYFCDYLSIYLAHDLALPYGVPKELYDELGFIPDLFKDIIYGTETNIRLSNYALGIELEKIIKDDKNLFTLFSLHDVNIEAFLRFFKFKPKDIPFGAYWLMKCYEDGCIEIEFYSDNTEKVYEFPSLEAFIEYQRKFTYKNDEDFLKELKCEVSDNIMKDYNEKSIIEIEKDKLI